MVGDKSVDVKEAFNKLCKLLDVEFKEGLYLDHGDESKNLFVFFEGEDGHKGIWDRRGELYDALSIVGEMIIPGFEILQLGGNHFGKAKAKKD